MIRYLFDTNIVSELVRRRPNPNVMTRYRAHEHEGAISSVVWHEITYGLERLAPGSRRDELARYVAEVIQKTLPVLAYDDRAAQWHAGERARLERVGRPRTLTDAKIAAVAATRGLILVTRNTDDFIDFEGLHLENWFVE